MARRRGAKKIDVVHWTTSGWVFSLASGTVAQLLIGAQHLPETLLRMRGSWSACLNGVVAPAIGLSIQMGIILVPEGTGSTVLWSPGSDGDAPWIWWDTFALLYDEQVADVIWSSQSSSTQRVIDSKAMRHIRNEELQVVAENTTFSGMNAGTVRSAGELRVLAGS